MAYGQWKSKPGNFDRLNLLHTYPGDGPWDIPILAPFEGELPDKTVCYDDWGRLSKKPPNAAVNFFTDDYRFEVCWNRPERALERMTGAAAIFTPDFSLYRNWPRAAQLWNVYRSRWLGARWQALGARVIPTIQWSTPESFDFAFDGLPKGNVVAVSSIGVFKRGETVAPGLFDAGYREMVARLEPRHILYYGEVFPEKLAELGPATHFTSVWQMNLRKLDRGANAGDTQQLQQGSRSGSRVAARPGQRHLLPAGGRGV